MKEFFIFKGMKYFRYLSLLYTLTMCSQSVKIKDEIKLSKKVKETSGLLYYNNDLITFNDSGGKPELYVISPTSGKIVRTVTVTNANNIDWEDITQDETYIYVADTGNNYGDRTDLVIYKILKLDFQKYNTVKAERIRYNYQDQETFGTKKNKTSFDCEAITTHGDQLLLFTKNWVHKTTTVYSLSKENGNYTALKQHTFAIDGLLTSVDYFKDTDKLIATVYTKKEKSFLVYLNLKNKNFSKIDITSKIGKESQVEGIAWKDKNEVYISREASKKKFKGEVYDHKQKIFLVKLKD